MSNRRKQARPSKLEDGGEFSAAAAEKETKSEDDLTGEEAMEEDEDEDDNYRDICHGKDVEDANNNESKSQDGSIDKEDLDEGETKERLTEAIQNLIGNFPWGSNNQPGNNSAQQGISLEAIQNTKAAMTQLTQALQNDQNSIQELAVLQSTLYTLQQQQILQLQLIQQLQHQLHVSNSAENSQHPDNNSSLSSPSPNSPEETQPILEVVKEKSPQPSEINKKDGLNPHFASLLNCANQDPNRPLSPGLMGGCDGGRGKGEEDVNTLEMLQKRAQEVLDSASQGLLASSLADDPNYRKKSGLGPYDKGREPFFKHRCRYCGKVFGSDSALQIHIRSHTGERPFKCNVCGSRFTTKGNLKVHFQRHTSKFPHVKMNPHPVPEHLDHFHPPLLSSGQTTPEHSPTFNIFNPFVPFRFDCPQDLRKPDGLENGDKLTGSSSKEFPEDFSNSKAGDESSCHGKVLGMMEDHVSSSKEYKENGSSSRDNYPESRVEDLRKEEPLPLHDHHHEHEHYSSSHHHHHHHPHHNKHHHHITSQPLQENQRRGGRERERERERERGQTADESSHDDDEELRNIEENKECEREIMREAESREREREEKEIKEMVKERLREKENNSKDFEKLPEKEKEIEPEKFNENSSHGDKCERWSNEPEIKEEFVSSDENEDDADFAEQPENLSSKSLPLMFPIPLQSLPVRPSSLNTTPLSPHHKFDPAKDPAIYTNLLPRPGSNDNAWESLIEVTKTSETTKLQQLVDNIEHKLTDPNQCIICHRVLSCKSALQMHYRTHTGERPFKCKICGRAFTTKGNLKTHMGVHRAKPPLRVLHQCPVCHKRFTNSLVLQQHIRLHTGEPTDLTPDQIRAAEVKDYPILPFNNQMFSPGSAKYDISDDSSSSEKDEQTLLLQQTQLQPPPPSFQSSIAALESQVHRMNYFDNNPTDLSKKESCNDRDSVVSDGDTGGGSGVLDLSKSVTESPPAVPPLPVFGHLPILPITRRGNTTCNICLKTFACNSALEIHYRSHTKERPFKCTVCDRGFSTKGNMKQHMLTHKIRDMPEKNGQSSDCDDSKDSHNSSFQRRSSEVVSPSSVSEGSCTKKRPCEEPEELTTNKKLASGGGLSSELTMDGGERASKHVCHVCTKSFSSSSSLHIHMRTHTGDKPFKCNVCSKAFTTKGNLKVHMGTHMWTNGASRRGRRMSLELPLGLHFPPPPPPPPQPAMKDVEAAAVLIHHHHHQHRRPQDLFYPYLPPSHLIVNNHLNHKPRDEAISSSSLSPPSGSPQNGLTIPKENISSD